jgi:hypothetical protein
MKVPVTLQIALAPSDYAHAQYMLPHHVRVWGSQVDEILLTIDFHRSPGRFSDRWAEGARNIQPLAESIEGARVVRVDYDQGAMKRVSAAFFGGRRVPLKDFRGGPYYSYFFGLVAARHDYVLHSDSDMFFGGGSQTWLAEAIAQMESEPNLFLTAPLSGPPRPDGRLLYLQATPDPKTPNVHTFAEMSSRVFLMQRSRFHSTIGALVPRRPPSLKTAAIAILDGHAPRDLPEHLFTAEMRTRGLFRRDFLGAAPGMWSLHPPYRCADFYAKLPELIRRVETSDVPAAQRGDHDLNDSMVDWSLPRAALRQNRIWHRMFARCRRALSKQ